MTRHDREKSRGAVGDLYVTKTRTFFVIGRITQFVTHFYADCWCSVSETNVGGTGIWIDRFVITQENLIERQSCD